MGRGQRPEGAGLKGMLSVEGGGGASVRRGPAAERRQRGGEHQPRGLHEGEVGQAGDHRGRLAAQVLLAPRLPGGRAGLLHGGHQAGEGVHHAPAAGLHLRRGELVQLRVHAWDGGRAAGA